MYHVYIPLNLINCAFYSPDRRPDSISTGSVFMLRKEQLGQDNLRIHHIILHQSSRKNRTFR